MSEETDNTDLQAQIDALNEKLAKAEKAKKDALGEKFKLANDLDEERTAREQEREEAERKAGDIAALEKRLTDKYEKQIEKLQADLESRDTDLRTYRVDNEISKALDGFDLLPGMKEVLTDSYKLRAKYEDGAGNIDGSPINEFIAAHLSGEQGAHYRKASDNSGGGASGNTSTTPKTTEFTKENFNLTKFSEIAKADPAKANAIAEDLGLPYRA